MDVAKYIGLFLLKNEQCYINGLGTLQLLRKPSQYDGQNLHAAHNEVTLVPGGNVDDGLANFIATNQMTSISKATDKLKEYSTETKAALQDGKEVAVPFIGSFALRDNRIIFLTDPLLLHKPANIPAERGASLQHNERPSDGKQPFVLPTAPPNPAVAMPGTQPPPPPSTQPDISPRGAQQAPQAEKTRLNWWRIIFVLLFLVIMAGAAYYAYQRFLAPKKRSSKTLNIPEMNDRRPTDDDDNRTEKEATQLDSTTNMAAETQAKEDTNEVEPIQAKEQQPEQKQPATEQTEEEKPKPKPTPPPQTQPKVEPRDMIAFKAVINTYDSKEQAYARARQLRKYGSAEVIEEDTNYYFVAIPIKTTKDRKKRVIDSLTNKYNQDGVFVY